MNTNMLTGGANISVSEIDALLGDLELSDDVLNEVEAQSVIEELPAEVIEAMETAPAMEELSEFGELDGDALSAVESMESREEIYAKTPEGSSVSVEPIVVTTTKKATKSAAPKIERDLTVLPDAAFTLTVGEEPNKSAVIGMRPTQKKIAEKFENLFQALSAGRSPSKYTMDCFRVLKAKGTVTSTELVAALQAVGVMSPTEGYSIGTARSQAGQLMALFSTLKVATRSGQSLVLRADSAVAEKLSALL